ncbi:hypothetical protein [Actinomarinicola tropica]|uniref:Uncharacterized protein n=1 Tax=Actinomarinicola tropica TaxID=2789776 RepID=A0A5Q2RIU7_9ACTN|nr:hypothetical protein [Actinomarinicola tropica]QGG95723.1 hypothetical protein GH723_11790 [Actinomarinicola tropica]
MTGLDPSGTPGHQIPGVPTDNVDQQTVLDRLVDEGYTEHLYPVDGGELRCGACDHTVAPDALQELVTRRMEGASDPDDMTLVVAGRCPDCDVAGTVVLAYGPAASPEDAAVLQRLPTTQEPT